jgi:bifunctional ADP-heptose synthase (sugar kinase/adenylyltransferase)
VLNDKIISLEKGSSINIPKKSRHRIINKEKEDLIFIEVQTGESFEEVDIVRIEDHYKRTSPKIILVSGGFDPIHSGHIEYFKEAKKLGDFLCVALNSDQ